MIRTPRNYRIAGMVALIILALTLAASSAGGNEIAGATYTGRAADGAKVTLTVSADGSKLDSFIIDGSQGNPALGDPCNLHSEGHPPGWQGAAITDHSFAFQWYYAVEMHGTFSGAQSVTGWFRLYQPASGQQAACDTGQVAFTLATTATPPAPGDPGQPPPGDGNPTTPTTTPRSSAIVRYGTKVRLSRKGRRLSGRVLSTGPGCQVRRAVLLRAGSKTIAKTKSGKDGSFRLMVPRSRKHMRVRVSVSAANSGTSRCGRAVSRTLVT
jgi:hypothetical protein